MTLLHFDFRKPVQRTGFITQHAHSRTAVRNSRTETVMHALIIWYLRAKT